MWGLHALDVVFFGANSVHLEDSKCFGLDVAGFSDVPDYLAVRPLLGSGPLSELDLVVAVARVFVLELVLDELVRNLVYDEPVQPVVNGSSEYDCFFHLALDALAALHFHQSRNLVRRVVGRT